MNKKHVKTINEKPKNCNKNFRTRLLMHLYAVIHIEVSHLLIRNLKTC